MVQEQIFFLNTLYYSGRVVTRIKFDKKKWDQRRLQDPFCSGGQNQYPRIFILQKHTLYDTHDYISAVTQEAFTDKKVLG